MGVSVDDYRIYVEDRKGHDFRYAINYSKINSKLKWIPRSSFRDGIKKTIEYYS